MMGAPRACVAAVCTAAVKHFKGIDSKTIRSCARDRPMSVIYVGLCSALTVDHGMHVDACVSCRYTRDHMCAEVQFLDPHWTLDIPKIRNTDWMAHPI